MYTTCGDGDVPGQMMVTVNTSCPSPLTAILLVYMKINKICPVHVKPPKKNEVKKIMKKHDLSEDGQLNKEEFTSVVDDIVAGQCLCTYMMYMTRKTF